MLSLISLDCEVAYHLLSYHWEQNEKLRLVTNRFFLSCYHMMHFEGIRIVLETHWLITQRHIFEPKNYKFSLFFFISVLRKLFVCFRKQKRFRFFYTSVLCWKLCNLESDRIFWNYKSKHFFLICFTISKYWAKIAELCERWVSKGWILSD